MVPYLRTVEIERRVQRLWSQHGLTLRFDVERLLDDLDLGLLWIPLEPLDGLVVAAELLPDIRKVCVNENLLTLFEQNPPLLRFTLSHEIGHSKLHAAQIAAGTISDPRAASGRLSCRQSDLDTPTRAAAAFRLEFQANLFASHLLAPDAILREQLARYGCDGWRATNHLARALGISPTALLVRLLQDGLAHRDSDGTPRPGPGIPAEQTSLGL